ncbi:CDP-glycerol glycerophosphotransferase, TagB/SpsB family [Lentibacillus persicus]|uniref:CDP-glycerol glycerophosphotransferase, TagB/SpsB family n=1 Tax=Lentibacillus persicus TaxID=640948 RepID=A0A1I1XUZ5_9BACI|nr:CDP-glycerol glycerophosphotransferase, TagB/SpsB family [Lentibacillus persicus]
MIAVYLLAFRMVFAFFKWFPKTNKTTFVASFGHNVLYTVRALENMTDQRVIILKTHKCCMAFDDSPRRRVIRFKFPHVLHWLRAIYHLATCKNVFVDNYYGFLAVTHFRTNVSCIQLWHAAGAIKTFGLKDKTIKHRHPLALRRFKKVYNRFDYVVTGSEKMASIFEEAFGLSGEHILKTGVPRTDFFFDTEDQFRKKSALTGQFPGIGHRKIILYAPTYRDGALDDSDLRLDIAKMYTELHRDYVLFLSLHPKMRVQTAYAYHDFVYDISGLENINHMLFMTDILISDYSSVPFEFALCCKPMVFFAYDLEEYSESKGFWTNYEELVPGPVVKDTESLIDVLKAGRFNIEEIGTFNHEWNYTSTGRSSEKLIQTLYHPNDTSTPHR